MITLYMNNNSNVIAATVKLYNFLKNNNVAFGLNRSFSINVQDLNILISPLGHFSVILLFRELYFYWLQGANPECWGQEICMESPGGHVFCEFKTQNYKQKAKIWNWTDLKTWNIIT